MLPPPPRSTLFPYTTLFRSLKLKRSGRELAGNLSTRGAQCHSACPYIDRKSTRLNSSHVAISYAVFCLKKKKKKNKEDERIITLTKKYYIATIMIQYYSYLD